MTPTRLRECLAALAWSQRGLADMVQVHERQVRRWASGDADMPLGVAAWLERIGSFFEANPPPVARVSRAQAVE